MPRSGMRWARSVAGSASTRVTRVGPRGRQEVVPVEQLETVVGRAQDLAGGRPAPAHPLPDRHPRLGGRCVARAGHGGAVPAAGRDPRARHRGHRRAPAARRVLDAHGLTLDPVTGEVAELEPLQRCHVEARRAGGAQPRAVRGGVGGGASGQEPGPVVTSRLTAMAWDHERPQQEAGHARQRGRVARRAGGRRLHPGPPRVRRPPGGGAG